jgi:hypothetical protein
MPKLAHSRNVFALTCSFRPASLKAAVFALVGGLIQGMRDTLTRYVPDHSHFSSLRPPDSNLSSSLPKSQLRQASQALGWPDAVAFATALAAPPPLGAITSSAAASAGGGASGGAGPSPGDVARWYACLETILSAQLK